MTETSKATSKPNLRKAPRPKLYLESRYQKLERGLPQTIFYCPVCKGDRRKRKNCERCEGFGKLTKDSVQEILSRRLVPALGARFGKFHGAGREDVDVLMLGRGRPFVFEAVGARRPDLDLDAFLEEFHTRNGERVRFAPFKRVEKARVAYWKEAKFDKVYRAEVKVSVLPDAARRAELIGQKREILQRTPQRVAHRRADLERERQVEICTMEALDEERLLMEVRCSHGTYVKEWISGDEGRTKSSLSDLLGCAAECAQLDVLEVLDE
ncbi:MAG: tRNA pseudouridine(54/55) synthase Pus10 [Planctomycetota bacterium]